MESGGEVIEVRVSEGGRSLAARRRFERVLLLSWFAYPLALGIAGLAVGFVAPDFPFLPAGGPAQLAAWAGIGVALGGFAALIHTGYSYWRNYLK